MDIETRIKGRHKIIFVDVNMDLYSLGRFGESFFRTIVGKKTNSIVVDLSNVSLLNSSFIGVLLSGYKKQKEQGGDFYLINVNIECLKVLELTGLDREFDIYANEEELPS